MNTSLRNLGDDALVEIYKSKRDADALGILFDRYHHLVYGVCMKYFKDVDMAKDHTMQVFEKLMKEIPRHEIQFFKAWLYRVTQNECLMTFRAQKKHPVKHVEEFRDEPVEFENGLHPKAQKEIMYDKLEQAMADLSPEQQHCIDLFYLQKKTYVEIMELTGFTFMQVKSYIQNGKRNLKIKITSWS